MKIKAKSFCILIMVLLGTLIIGYNNDLLSSESISERVEEEEVEIEDDSCVDLNSSSFQCANGGSGPVALAAQEFNYTSSETHFDVHQSEFISEHAPSKEGLYILYCSLKLHF
ncbi:MAG: hypothetical protein ACI837_002832 [Crocinitomicaceae bacterium]|jgi:hypothetical protein